MNNKKFKKLYYEARVGYQVLGCLLKKHELLQEPEYDLKIDYFHTEYHKAIFFAIHNLIAEGIEEITAIEIESYLNSNSPRWYKIVFEDDDGMEWIENAIEQATLSNFRYNYDRLRKFSVLRDLIEEGQDVTDILDLTEVDNEIITAQSTEFDKMKWDDITKHYAFKIDAIDNKYEAATDGSYMRAGSCAEETKRRLKAGESYGLMGKSGYKNKVTLGARRKKFNLTSGGTGAGKFYLRVA